MLADPPTSRITAACCASSAYCVVMISRSTTTIFLLYTETYTTVQICPTRWGTQFDYEIISCNQSKRMFRSCLQRGKTSLPYHAMKIYGGGGVIALRVLNLSTTQRWANSFNLQMLWPLGKRTWYLSDRGRCGSQSRFGCCGEERITALIGNRTSIIQSSSSYAGIAVNKLL
jgi:hypothetical protein